MGSGIGLGLPLPRWYKKICVGVKIPSAWSLGIVQAHSKTFHGSVLAVCIVWRFREPLLYLKFLSFVTLKELPLHPNNVASMLERLFLVFLTVVCHCGCTSLGFNGTTPIHDLHVALCVVRPYLSRKHKPSVQAHSAQALRKLPNAMDLPLALSHVDCVWGVFPACCFVIGETCAV